MAATPYFILSPNTVLSTIGLIRGPDRTVPTPAEDWRKAKVEVVIPALNEESNIVLCLDSLTRQTRRPNRIVLVDDGSTDRTLEFARDFARQSGLDITIIHRPKPAGKTPTVKQEARESDADVEFILDADTVLVSPEYIERTVQELYQAVGIACACGSVLSMLVSDRRRAVRSPAVRAFLEAHPDASFIAKRRFHERVQMAMTSLYRECLYLFLQRFVYVGQMKFFGSISHPVGCAVAYRRKYIRELFDYYEPILGDDLTNSEDIFIGFALINHGYRNIQLGDVVCRSQEPPLRVLPRQFYMWSSSFLQSCYYFNSLTATPFKAIRRWQYHWRAKHTRAGREIAEKRKISEPYREPFGDQFTRDLGRPIGWSIFLSLVEKIAFPLVLLGLLVTGKWEPLLLTAALESAIALGILTTVAPAGHRLEFLGKGVITTPVRYSVLLFDVVTLFRFASDCWIRKGERWRK